MTSSFLVEVIVGEKEMKYFLGEGNHFRDLGSIPDVVNFFFCLLPFSIFNSVQYKMGCGGKGLVLKVPSRC